MRIHCILHESFEGLGCINDWIIAKKHSFTITHTYLNETFPDVNAFDLLIIMGGTASVYEMDKHQWLKEEKKFISRAVKKDCKILGICFGAQLLADVLGAKVYKGPYKEIGWFPVSFNKTDLSQLHFLPEIMDVFHWHGDTFDIPVGAVRMGSSEAIPNQGFVFGKNIISLQFHLEMNSQQIQTMLKSGASELKENAKYIQSVEQILSNNDFFADNNRLMYSILDYLSN